MGRRVKGHEFDGCKKFGFVIRCGCSRNAQNCRSPESDRDLVRCKEQASIRKGRINLVFLDILIDILQYAQSIRPLAAIACQSWK